MQLINVKMENLANATLIDMIMNGGATAVNLVSGADVRVPGHRREVLLGSGIIGGNEAEVLRAQPKAKPTKATKTSASKPAKKVKLLKPKAATKTKPGAKRSPRELGELVEKLHAYIAANSGQGMEQIAKAFKVPSKSLTLPLKKLTEAKAVYGKGQKRATRYFPAAAKKAA